MKKENSIEKKKFGLMGCGRVATRHSDAINTSNYAELKAVCDIDEEKAAALGKAIGVPFYSNYHEMLTENPDIAVVNIITPSGMHFEHAMDVIKIHRRKRPIQNCINNSARQG